MFGRFAKQIKDGGSSRVLLMEGMTQGEEPNESAVPPQRHPDGQFQHYQAAYPGVVLEVSYSQDGKDLERLAWEYIQGSNGDIKAVIGIDINYTKDSTISLWRPSYIANDGEEMDILDVKTHIAAHVGGLWSSSE